jgi:hypothetical protein
MRNEVIKLTDEAIYPELIKLLDNSGPLWADLRLWNKDAEKILFFGGFWTRIFPPYKSDYTITDTEFLQKYGNTEPEPAPAWTFKTDDELTYFIATFLASKHQNMSEYIASIRKPAFELICEDGVVTDREQKVWWVSPLFVFNKGKASDMKDWGYRCWISEQAALNHRLHNTPAIKLSDMMFDNDIYWMSKDKAEKLVNERNNAK